MPLKVSQASSSKTPSFSPNEWLQKKHREIPKFTLVSQEGPAHAPQFTVQVVIDKKKFGEGTSGSKKDAEQIAAKVAYEKLSVVSA